MKTTMGAAALGLALLAGCTRQDVTPELTNALDETITLSRTGASDSAQRVLTLQDDSIIVAIADERLTDVRLGISSSTDGKLDSSSEVENHLAGAGIEIATLSAPKGA